MSQDGHFEEIVKLNQRVDKLEKTLNRLVNWLNWFLHQELGNGANEIRDIYEKKPPEYLGMEDDE